MDIDKMKNVFLFVVVLRVPSEMNTSPWFACSDISKNLIVN